MGHLSSLESLILDGSDLKYLPQGFGKLKKLKHLSLNYCSKLAFLSEELGMLSSLKTLSLNSCKKLTALPKSLGGLRSLHTFQFKRCINLTALPESLGGLLYLQTLEFNECTNLQELPESLGELRIQSLNLHSLVNLSELPNSFVQLKSLETLEIKNCTKLCLLPKDFGLLRFLKHMTVSGCDLLKELPRDFGALPALKTLKLEWCSSFVNLPEGFSELTSLEELSLVGLRLMSRIPDGLRKLRKLRLLNVSSCAQLKTSSDDFENMATLERLSIKYCSELDGAMMEKIVKLPNCYMAEIDGSTKMIEKWEHMQGKTKHPIVVLCGDMKRDVGRAIGVALLNGKCVEVKNGSDQLMERSSLFAGLELEDGTTATLALIMLPIKMQSNQQETIERYVKMATERAESNGSDTLQIVCARKVDLWAKRSTATEEEERAEEGGGIGEVLVSLPLGSCAIPSAESKRLKVLTFCCDEYSRRVDKLSFIMANVGLDREGREIFENLEVMKEDEISANVVMESPSEMRKAEEEDYNSIQNFIESICPKDRWDVRETDGQSECECVAGESRRDEFRKALKDSGIDYLLNDNNKTKLMVDDLHGKAIGFIICDFKASECIVSECIKLQQVYKHLQHKDSNFIWIWIPTSLDFGHGSYTRLIQCMPWATFPDSHLVHVDDIEPCFVVLDRHGHIANSDAFPLLLGWDVESYPFTRHTIPESLSLVESESCLELLLHGMNIVGRKPMTSKMTFLDARCPDYGRTMKCKLDDLTQIHGSFEVLYVAELSTWRTYNNIGGVKKDYEDAIQKIRWPSLSFSDMIMFWNRCKYLASEKMYELYKKANTRMETLHRLAKDLCSAFTTVALVDNDGHIVTCGGLDVVEMICESSDGMRMVKDEVMRSLSRGECSRIVRTFFRDEIVNHPQHHQHPINFGCRGINHKCNVCGGGCNEGRTYWCWECRWYMCGSCWMAYAEQEVEELCFLRCVYSLKYC